jgi:hypothetical protein
MWCHLNAYQKYSKMVHLQLAWDLESGLDNVLLFKSYIYLAMLINVKGFKMKQMCGFKCTVMGTNDEGCEQPPL